MLQVVLRPARGTSWTTREEMVKAQAEQTFRCTLELNREEAETIKEALGVIVDLAESDLEENDITKSTWRTAKKILPQLEEALLEKNWRE
jgi:hypothetical protein